MNHVALFQNLFSYCRDQGVFSLEDYSSKEVVVSLLSCSRVILFKKNAADLGGEASYRAVFTNHPRELRSWKMTAWGSPQNHCLLCSICHFLRCNVLSGVGSFRHVGKKTVFGCLFQEWVIEAGK